MSYPRTCCRTQPGEDHASYCRDFAVEDQNSIRRLRVLADEHHEYDKAAQMHFASTPISDLSVEEAAQHVLEQTTGLVSDDGHGDETAARFVKMLRALTLREPFEFTCFPNTEGINEIVLQSEIDFVSLCNHHVLPFMGKAHVAYIPGQKIVGLSKLARVVKYYAAGLQVQERLTSQIADRLEEELEPQGVAVIMQATHTCMTIRGVKAQGSYTTTSAMRGAFADHDRTAKAELFQLIMSAREM